MLRFVVIFYSLISVVFAQKCEVNISPEGPLVICQFQSTTLETSYDPSFQYQWYFNGNPVTANPIHQYPATGSGVYQLVITDNMSCTASSNKVYTSQNPAPEKPQVTQDGNSLKAASKEFTFQWYKDFQSIFGADDSIINLNQSGVYKVVVTNRFGCTRASDWFDFVLDTCQALISPTGPVIACEGSNVLLTASEGEKYKWSNSGTTMDLEGSVCQVTSSGIYKVTITDRNGCTSASNSVKVTINPYPPLPSFVQEVDTLRCFPSNLKRYDWYFNTQFLSTSTFNVIYPDKEGTYTVEVLNEFNCKRKSEPYLFKFNSILENSPLAKLKAYLDNSKGVITLSNVPIGSTFLLVSVDGRSQKGLCNKSNFDILLAQQNSGLVILEIQYKQHRFVQKFLQFR